MKTLKPGEVYICRRTYSTHQWICIPITDWFITHPVSNIGFTFWINVLKVQSYDCPFLSGVDRRSVFLKTITDPESTHPIKSHQTNHTSFKQSTAKLFLNPELIQSKLTHFQKLNLADSDNRQHLLDRIKLLEGHLAHRDNEIKRMHLQLSSCGSLK